MLFLLPCAVFFFRYSPEGNFVASPQQAWNFLFRTKQPDRRTADQLPAARRFNWIDACLFAGNADGSFGNTQPWRITPRRCDFLRHAADERKTGSKTNHGNRISAGSVDIDYLFRCQSVVFSHKIEVRAKLAPVADRDLHCPRKGRWDF